MDATEGTKIRAVTVEQGQTVNCRDWLECAVVDVTWHGVRIRYRVFDTDTPNMVESPQPAPAGHDNP